MTMDDRTLAFYDDAWEMRGPDALPGRHMVLRIEQSRENRNELHFVIEKHRRSKQWGNPQWDEMSIYVPDAATFLAPVVEWLNGGTDVEPEWEYGWAADEALRSAMSPRGPRIQIDGLPDTPENIARFQRGARIRRRKAGPWEEVVPSD